MGFIAEIFSPSKPKPKPIVAPSQKVDPVSDEAKERRRRGRTSLATRRGEFGGGAITRPGLKTTLG